MTTRIFKLKKIKKIQVEHGDGEGFVSIRCARSPRPNEYHSDANFYKTNLNLGDYIVVLPDRDPDYDDLVHIILPDAQSCWITDPLTWSSVVWEEQR